MAGAGSAARAAAKAAGGQTGVGKLIGKLGGVGGLLSIGSSVAGLLGGIGQKKKAKRAMAEAEKLNPGVEGYQSIANEAQQAAREGMGAQEYNLASTNIQRGTASALGAAGKLSNPIGAISSINRNQNDAFSKLDASNYGLKRQNRQASWAAQAQLQQARQQQYADAYNAAQSLMGAGQQNVAGSLGALGQFGLMQSIYGQNNKGENNPAAAARRAAAASRRAGTGIGAGAGAVAGSSLNLTPNLNYNIPGMSNLLKNKFGGYGGPLGVGDSYYDSNQ